MTSTTQPKTILSITSYALKGPPLDFKPDVHLSARRIINPPLQLRKSFDGRCEQLRRNLRADPEFQTLLHDAQPQILDAEKRLRGDAEQVVEVKVAVSCVRGRHRSVAVAEELAKLPVWPESFEVRVCHRDVDSPHRYRELHRKNLEREERGEDVDVMEEAVEEVDSDVDDMSNGGGNTDVGEGGRGEGEVEGKQKNRLNEGEKSLNRVDSRWLNDAMAELEVLPE